MPVHSGPLTTTGPLFELGSGFPSPPTVLSGTIHPSILTKKQLRVCTLLQKASFDGMLHDVIMEPKGDSTGSHAGIDKRNM